MQTPDNRPPDPTTQYRRALEADPTLLAEAAEGRGTVTKFVPPEWPKPLAEQAFYGLAGKIVRAIEPHTEADPAALLVQFLVALGNCSGRETTFRVEADSHSGNLFSVIVGVTSKGRKGTSWRHIRRVFEQADDTWARDCVASGLSSGEGVIWSVRDPIEKEKRGRNGEMETVVEDEGVADKRLLVVEAEFASPLSVMAREGNTLSAVLRDAWDGGDLRILTKNSPAVATGAHVSVIAHVTKEELLRHLNSTEQSNGFANRMLWVCARRSKILPDGGNFRMEAIEPQLSRLRQCLSFARQDKVLTRDPESQEIWRTVYPKLSDGKPGLLGSVTSRAEAQVVRLSLLYAVLDCSKVIRREHMLAALGVWDYCEASARFIFGDSLGYPEADRILGELISCPDGLTRTAIRNLFARHRSEAEITAALNCLAERGMAYRRSVQTGGRPEERWFASGSAPIAP